MAKVRFILLSVLALLSLSCRKEGGDPLGEETRKVMLLYEAGFNSLGPPIAGNIQSLKKGYLPGKGRNDDILLVFSHITKSDYNYVTETAPSLVRLYAKRGQPCADTLKVWPVGTPVANAETLTEVFNLVKEEFPAAGYGAVLSSHGTGWLPEDYFSHSSRYESVPRGGGSIIWSVPRRRTFGQEYCEGGTRSQEIEIRDLAKAIPYKLDYILFDACLMGTVEVAWQLREVCDLLAVSPCEIPDKGFNYDTMAKHLLKPETPDLKAVCQDYYDAYENDSVYGATITLVDCRSLDRLAEVCRDLFSRYRLSIRTLNGSNVQVYDRMLGKKTFYAFFDLKDMLREAGASDEDLALLQGALDEAILYKNHTPRFISVKLERCCGLSMYLPSRSDNTTDIWHGTEFLDGFYRSNISWNDATGLVQ